MTGAAIRAGFAEVAKLAVLPLVVMVALLGVGRCSEKPSPVPAQLAREDEKTGSRSADFIAAETTRQTDAARVQIDLTTKDIRDAFDTLPPPAQPVPSGATAPALPAAPVDRLRDRLNEGIARANRAAGDASAAR